MACAMARAGIIAGPDGARIACPKAPCAASSGKGLDYTPLFKFLLSRVGDDWEAVHADAVARLDRVEPIFWMVARSEAERKPFVLIGENAYYSGLFVDEDNRLRMVDPELQVEQMAPSCACCTHTLNGVPFTRKYVPPAG